MVARFNSSYYIACPPPALVRWVRLPSSPEAPPFQARMEAMLKHGIAKFTSLSSAFARVLGSIREHLGRNSLRIRIEASNYSDPNLIVSPRRGRRPAA